jgi:uncharacterized small protein (DUF1192 family)
MPALFPDPPGDRLASVADVDRLSRQIAELTAAIERHERSLKMGLTRMGQLQADIDRIRTASAKLKTGT